MKPYGTVALLTLVLAGACKKEDVPLQPTTLSLQVVFLSTGLPVDSAFVTVLGTKGGYLAGSREIAYYAQGYTDQKGQFKANMMVPRDYSATFTTGKLIKVGNQYKLYDLSVILPDNTFFLKREQENNVVVKLDTLK